MRLAACSGAQERGVRVRSSRRVALGAERCWSRRVVKGVEGVGVERDVRWDNGIAGCSLVDHLVRMARRVGRLAESCACMWLQISEVGVAWVAEKGRFFELDLCGDCRDWRRLSSRVQRVRAAASAA